MYLGVLSDTHIPDRVRSLNPQVLTLFRQRQVNAILHAGDICAPQVLAHLDEIAPVYAVRGNRDWALLPHLPFHRSLLFDGVEIGLTHGHGSARQYWLGKLQWILQGYRLERFVTRLTLLFPQAGVIVFGHSHRPVNENIAGRLFFNPGSTCHPDGNDLLPSVGFLHIHAGTVSGEIVYLA